MPHTLLKSVAGGGGMEAFMPVHINFPAATYLQMKHAALHKDYGLSAARPVS